MKHFCTLAVLILAACTTTKKTSLTSTSSNQAFEDVADSIVYYKTTFEADQKDYLHMMLGNWTIHSMQRQVKLPEETLNIPLQLNADKTFVIKTTCGDMKGTFAVKGVSIKFNDVSHINCANSEQLNEMIRLLTNTVSMYTVNGNMLSLKDNSSNNVFRASR